VLACDTPANLKRKVQAYPIFTLSLAPGSDGVTAVAAVPGVHQATRTETPESVELKVALTDEAAIGGVVQAVAGAGGRLLTLKKQEPTLEDVFIELVGHGLQDDTVTR
jgi:ABC-2 type transport system ATP-binding protein